MHTVAAATAAAGTNLPSKLVAVANAAAAAAPYLGRLRTQDEWQMHKPFPNSLIFTTNI